MVGVLQIQNVGAVSGKVIGRKHTVEDVGVVFRIKWGFVQSELWYWRLRLWRYVSGKSNEQL